MTRLAEMVALTSLFTAPAAAQAAPFDFACTAPLESGSEIWRTQGAATYSVRGTIRPTTLARLPPDPSIMVGNQIQPVTRAVTVVVGMPTENSYVSLQLLADLDGVALDLAVVHAIGGRDGHADLARFGWQPGAGLSVPFEIRVEPGRVIVEAAGRRTEIPLALGASSEVRIGCIGGRFHFDNIDWGG